MILVEDTYELYCVDYYIQYFLIKYNYENYSIITENYTHLTPAQALELLKEGNKRFITDNFVVVNSSTTRVHQLANGQTPFAAVFGCSDSRNTPSVIFNRGVGDIFETRTAGEILYNNIIKGTDISKQTIESIEFSIQVLKCPLIVILGHTQCGAIQATYDYFKNSKNPVPATSDITYNTIYNSLYNAYSKLDKNTSTPCDDMAIFQTEDVSQYLFDHSQIIKNAVNEGKTMIVQAIYDVETGKVTFSK